MMVYSDSLRTYRSGVASGSFDADLDTDTRESVVRRLDNAIHILETYGGSTDSATLTRQTVSPVSDPWAIVTRVSDILSGVAAGSFQHRPSVWSDAS